MYIRCAVAILPSGRLSVAIRLLLISVALASVLTAPHHLLHTAHISHKPHATSCTTCTSTPLAPYTPCTSHTLRCPRPKFRERDPHISFMNFRDYHLNVAIISTKLLFITTCMGKGKIFSKDAEDSPSFAQKLCEKHALASFLCLLEGSRSS